MLVEDAERSIRRGLALVQDQATDSLLIARQLELCCRASPSASEYMPFAIGGSAGVDEFRKSDACTSLLCLLLTEISINYIDA